jgi:hypothetical protein
MLVDWLASRMTLVWIAYFSIAELLSLLPSQVSSCVLISEEAKTENYSGNYACASMHEAIFRVIRYIWHHAGHDHIIAFGTCLIALFTYVLYRSTNNLWKVSKEQIDLARDEFLFTHRPRLKVRRVFIPPPIELMLGQELNASIEIVNIGGNEATIFWSRYRIYFGKDDYSIVGHYVPPHVLPGGRVVFEPGSRYIFELVDRVPQNVAESGTLIRPKFGEDDWKMYIIGEVRYQDRLGTIRHLGFCRKMQGDHRFRAVNDPDYEYED